MSRFMVQVQRFFAAEAGRLFLWVPVCFAAGIALYMALPEEPASWLLPTIFLSVVVAAVVFMRMARIVMTVALWMSVGACWAQIYAQWNPPVMLSESLSPRMVSGAVRELVRNETGVRLLLEEVEVARVAADATPQRIRLSVRLPQENPPPLPHIGDRVEITAGLRPPMGPALPHGFDFARYFYFKGIGAVGYGLPPWEVTPPLTEASFGNQFRNWRVGITEQILATLGSRNGAVAAGLITGDARAIPRADFEALRASNLYHIIAISGEHMVVIAGVIFITLRMLALALPKRYALHPRIKTMAAAITLILITAYLYVTGLPTSAVRAYAMIFLVLLAVLLRRQVDPMRSLALAALAMLVVDPSNVLDPGFQLSFAATLALIAVVETRLLKPMDALEVGRFRRVIRMVLTLILMSVVAEIATAPLVIAQFNNMSLYGVFANLLATPLMSFFLMPTVALYFVLLPFGGQSAALWLMDQGIDALLGIAHGIAALPYAQWFVPSIPWYGLALFTPGLLWVCLWRSHPRKWGIVPMVLGVATLALVDLPDMLVGEGLQQIVFRGESGYVRARGRATSMVPNLWANGLGYGELPEAEAPDWRCERLGCVARVRGRLVAFPVDATALAEDCTQADMVVTLYGGAACASTIPVVDAERLHRVNVLAFWQTPQGHFRLESSANWQGNRPWQGGVAVVEEEK